MLARFLIAVSLLGMTAATAEAAEPPSSRVVNVVRAVEGKETFGRLRLGVKFSPGGAHAEVPSLRLRLRKPGDYRIQLCVEGRVKAGIPRTNCQSRRATIRQHARSVRTLGTGMFITRPKSAEKPGYFAVQAYVTRRAPNSRRDLPFAVSMPRSGLADASIPIPVIGADTAPRPQARGVRWGGTFAGGINTGTRDSFCAGERKSATAPAPPGASIDSLGNLPFPYEVREPSGPVKGVVFLFHSGGWFGWGPGALEEMRPAADRWLARGWRTVNSSYRPCGHSVFDAATLITQARRLYGPTLPFCTVGSSAGGHLALLAAFGLESISCAVTMGGALGDPRALPFQQAAHASEAGQTWPDGPRYLYNLMVAAFGPDQMDFVSPVTRERRVPVLSGVAARDALLPFEQASSLAAASAGEALLLADGDEAFTHAPVSSDALANFVQREGDLAARFAP